MTADDGHDAEHLFQGVCICSCRRCTQTVGVSQVRCICSLCPWASCGCKTPYPAVAA